jgi:DNA-binding transcriptional LysR family regulator
MIAIAGLSKPVRSVRRRMPAIQVAVQDGFLQVALSKLHEGTLDSVVPIVDQRKVSAEFRCQQIMDEELVVCGQKGHPLERFRSIAAAGRGVGNK